MYASLCFQYSLHVLHVLRAMTGIANISVIYINQLRLIGLAYTLFIFIYSTMQIKRDYTVA